VPHIVEKILTRATYFISIKGLHTKLWASKVVGVPILGISGLPGQNNICVLAPLPSTKNTIRGRWWFRPSLSHGEFCEFVFAPNLSMHQKCSNCALIKLLFGLHRSVGIIESFYRSFWSHLGALARPSTLKCCEPGSAPQLFLLSLFSLVNS